MQQQAGKATEVHGLLFVYLGDGNNLYVVSC